MISMIWAMARNNVIGKDNDLPWDLPEDLKHFKKTTMGKPVIMGLRTFYSLKKALPGRRNIVLNYDKIDLPGAEVATSIPQALEMVDGDVFVIGGGSIYKQFLPKADRLYMTYIDEDFEGDVFFPEIDYSRWKLIEEKKGPKDKKNPYDYYFRVYERI